MTKQKITRSIIDERSGRLRARTIDEDLGELADRLSAQAVESGKIRYTQILGGWIYANAYSWPWHAEAAIVVAFPEGHVLVRACDETLRSPTDASWEWVRSGAVWPPVHTRQVALWAAEKLGLADTDWSVARRANYRAARVGDWYGTHLSPAGAAALKALGVSPEMFGAHFESLAPYSPRTASGLASRLRKADREVAKAA